MITYHYGRAVTGARAVGPGAHLPAFELHRPRTLRAACELLAELGPDAHVYAGGTELLLVMRAGLADARHLVDVKRVPGLGSVWKAGEGTLRVGAAATHARLARSPQVAAMLPALEEAERDVGNVRVRCTGTIGGNLCFAEPNSDPATVLVAHGASLTLESVRGTRRMTLDEFLLGPLETAREADEILTHVDVPLLPRHGAAYVRFMTTEERPIATAAALLRADGDTLADVRIVVGATGPRPVRLPATEAAAAELAVDAPAEQLRELGRLAAREADVASDRSGPEDYKRHVVGLIVARAVEVGRARARAAAAPDAA